MKKAWWKESVVYQIYPRSFKDSNGDGIGDLRGIIEKLDYLKFLGVDVLWLCPIYKSPNCDNGYDISDYKDIMDEFGTMEDFDELLFEAHKRGLKILMDLVVNHTSDEHIWFINSRKSKDNEYRDYYIWRKGKDGKEPNNWGSSFSGSAWEYDEATDMYYLHCFAKKQPDLNWENEKVRKEVQDIVKWWLDKGIDGFRMDVINMISKDQRFPDGIVPEGGLYGDMSPYVMNGPRVHEYLKELNEKVLSKYDIMTVGETPCVTPEIAIDYVGEDRNELNMVFSFEHMDIDKDVINLTKKPLDLVELKKIMSKWQKGMSDRGWNSLYWNNHDQPRVVSRFGNDTEYWDKSAKMLATCLHMQQGTPYIYQGEEIGMTNVRFQDIEDYRDIAVINGYNEEVIIKGRSHEQYMQYIYDFSRDNARTPMQWDDSDNGGFTTGKPWIKVNPNYTKINVAKQIGDKDSILNYYRRLIKLRKENEIIIYGDFELILPDDKNIFSYTRKLNDEMLLVICNFTSNNAEFSLPDNINYVNKNLLISNYDVANDDNIENFELRAYESRVYLLKV
ncbi:alpha amylase catalytic region [Thermoanaerobacterium thermosaccharolyticum DSM 571]|uniref:Alpha amylase catalytic region n=1 Tax=Thermoanaerobacterium thermosaccharolyticum (strain ATCC 7956 / DSM 571 / NCIMB 9385 / NCA 3814 / NCTC 13789 / WDCM 00135 / 2032) TaxID=580327 RepID=D9TT11_THETC|nr:alpha-glucosidase [Thermoanaerobacterium thermosaccharolyticum]ADL69409.1 alpha amylase catalytic region [Thermoanaerobacterium thermosaccharolyticum DSM 571]